MKPVIGVNCEYDEDGTCFLKKDYTDAIVRAGGIPFMLSIVEQKELMLEQVNLIDGLLLSGGRDISPERYGETLHENMKLMPKQKEDFDFMLARHALETDLPVLGLCYGLQLINVCLGGTLIQDIPSQYETTTKHRSDDETHSIFVDKDSKLFKILKHESIEINSTHHQSIKVLGKSLIKSAAADDGIIEAIESTGHTFVVGVQWHPERMTGVDAHLALFKALVGIAGSSHGKRKM